MSWWNAKYKNDHDEYEITFGSKYKEKTKIVEKVCKWIIDKLVQSEDDIAIVRHGRWIFKDDDGAYPWTTKAICSECKEVIAWNSSLALEDRQIEFAEENHYCPNCGAKMDGNEHGNVEM